MKYRDFELREVPLREGTALGLVDLTDDKMDPLVVDFLSGALLHRLRHGLSKNDPLPRALGMKSRNPAAAPYVLDATAGLGTDALILAALGCRVRSIERSPMTATLLLDGLKRFRVAAEEDEFFHEVSQRLSFEEGDAVKVLQALSEAERPDVVYLDPMYPEESHSKSALPKKTMQIFRRLLDGDEDAEQLWQVAMTKARARVVVKRPLKAQPLGQSIGRTPTHQFEGKTARFDMYLV